MSRLRVRYKKFADWTDWMPCREVRVEGSWLVIEVDESRRIYVSDRIVRGEVQVEALPPQ